MSDSLTLEIQVAPEDLAIVKDGGYNLYITRDVATGSGREEQTGNVIFSAVANDKLAPNMVLTWSESYKVFETLQSTPGVHVTSGTGLASIEGGKQAAFDEDGVAHISGSAKHGDPFKVVNNWIHGASVAVSNEDPQTKKYAPIYVSKSNPIHTTSVLHPTKRFNVFWERDLTTSFIIDTTSTPAYKADLTDGKKAIKYEGGEWADNEL